MSNEQKVEEAVLKIAEQLESFLDNFVIAMGTTVTAPQEKWYNPKQFVLRIVKTSALASTSLSPELQLVTSAAYGLISCLGFRGTLSLILELRRRHGRQTKS